MWAPPTSAAQTQFGFSCWILAMVVWFSVIPSWDAGTNFDSAWADAWNSPTEYSDSDSYVSEYL